MVCAMSLIKIQKPQESIIGFSIFIIRKLFNPMFGFCSQSLSFGWFALCGNMLEQVLFFVEHNVFPFYWPHDPINSLIIKPRFLLLLLLQMEKSCSKEMRIPLQRDKETTTIKLHFEHRKPCLTAAVPNLGYEYPKGYMSNLKGYARFKSYADLSNINY